MSQSANNVTQHPACASRSDVPLHIHRKAVIPKRALCVSLEGLAKRAEAGDPRAQELLVESLVYLERALTVVE